MGPTNATTYVAQLGPSPQGSNQNLIAPAQKAVPSGTSQEQPVGRDEQVIVAPPSPVQDGGSQVAPNTSRNPDAGVQWSPARSPSSSLSESQVSVPPGRDLIKLDGFGDPLTLICGVLIGCSLAWAVVVFFRWRGSQNADAIVQIEQEIAAALHKPGLRLERVASEIGLLETMAADVISENRTLRQSSAVLAAKLEQMKIGPERRRAEAVVVFIEDALRAIEALMHDPEFKELDGTLSLQSGFTTAVTELKKVHDGREFNSILVSTLERGHLNVVLTSSAFLEAYFGDRPRWRLLRATTRASDASLRSLLEENGVQIVLMQILSVVSPGDIRDAEVSDSRNVRLIPSIQRAAARAARDLGNRELLIVDCPAPGWISERIGRRQPALAVFDPASWT